MDRCPTCRKPPAVCVCERTAPVAVRLKVVVLQHPQEQDEVLGTVPLLEGAIGAVRRVGLSWPHLGRAVDAVNPGRWAVVWPTQLPRPLTPDEAARPVVRVGGADALDGVLALDGTWSQAKALWWRNPWLQRLDRVVIHPATPSIYGRLRLEPRREAVSTLEAVAAALVGLGEPPEVEAELRRLMRTMVQRARDAALQARTGGGDERGNAGR